jgi:hypothetical protein
MYKKEKERLLSIIDELDIKAETSPLNTSESGRLRDANEKNIEIKKGRRIQMDTKSKG